MSALIRRACLLEATARKPGNVHPDASFPDLRYEHFVQAAEVTAPVLARSRQQGVGATILAATQLTRSAIGTNANLGIILLLAPLAAVPSDRKIAAGVDEVLRGLTVEDARAVYEAIRIAQPGGLGKVEDQDIASEPTETLTTVMARAADRDRVAQQYATGFRDLVSTTVPMLRHWLERAAGDWDVAIIGTHLLTLAMWPDSLIARKCGFDAAMQVTRRAHALLKTGWPDSMTAAADLAEFDRWLRSDGNRLNPGTTADLIAATIYLLLRDVPLPELWQRRSIEFVAQSSPVDGAARNRE
ncbi:MAG: triphosphoribosyl-dephospho-CoA synthase [Planctomycetaceae bacterium]